MNTKNQLRNMKYSFKVIFICYIIRFVVTHLNSINSLIKMAQDQIEYKEISLHNKSK